MSDNLIMDIEQKLEELNDRVSRCESQAERAMKMSIDARDISIKTEERAKSIQHRMDDQEERLEQIRKDLESIRGSTAELKDILVGNTRLINGLMTGMKALVSILGFASAILTITKLILNI